MNDTPPEIAGLVRQRLMARSAEERSLMGVRRFDAAPTMALPAGLSPDEFETPAFPTALWSTAASLSPPSAATASTCDSGSSFENSR
jgi:hypothetical protein